MSLESRNFGSNTRLRLLSLKKLTFLCRASISPYSRKSSKTLKPLRQKWLSLDKTLKLFTIILQPIRIRPQVVTSKWEFFWEWLWNQANYSCKILWIRCSSDFSFFRSPSLSFYTNQSTFWTIFGVNCHPSRCILANHSTLAITKDQLSQSCFWFSRWINIKRSHWNS